MAYVKDYAKLEGAAKKAAAIQDIIDYVGMEKFVKVTESARQDGAKAPEGRLALGTFDFFLGFAGVQGYPVRAWYALIWGDEALVAEEAKSSAEEEAAS